jgi:hypothetical protein
MYYNPDTPSTGYPVPSWIVFKHGKHQARMPFGAHPQACAWDRVLEITSLGFRADRVGDSIVITGNPSDFAGALS